jgi:hypothetical protein
MITTYKGQSGSPLFLRIKNEKLKEIRKEELITNPNEKYSYIFLGLHSRSPDIIESIDIIGKKKSIDYNIFNKRNNNYNNLSSDISQLNVNLNSNSNNNINTNTNTNSNSNSMKKTIDINIDLFNINGKNNINDNDNYNDYDNESTINIRFKEVLNKGNPEEINNFLINNLKYFLKDKEHLYEMEKQKNIEDFVNKNYYCSYNVGLKINKKILKEIKIKLKQYRAINNLENSKIYNDNNQNYFNDYVNDNDFDNNNYDYSKRRMTEKILNFKGKEISEVEDISLSFGNSLDYKIEYIINKENEEEKNKKKVKIEKKKEDNDAIKEKENQNENENKNLKEKLFINSNNNINSNINVNPKNNNKKLAIYEEENNNYFLINFYIYGDFIFKGIFNFTNKFRILLEITSQYLEIDKEFLQLQINEKILNINSNGLDYINLLFNSNDNDNRDSENLIICNSFIFRKIIYINFRVDIESFSEVISKKLISKLYDNVKNFDIKKEINNTDENLKIILKYIFNEIHFLLEKSSYLHGLLFNCIKNKILFQS